MINIPMLATEMARQIYLWYDKSWKKRDGFIAGWCALLLLAGYAGTFTPYSVGQETTRNVRRGLAKLWNTVLPQAFEALGFAGVEGIGRGVPLFFLLIAMGVLGVCLFRLLNRGGGKTAGLGVSADVDVAWRDDGCGGVYNDRVFQ